MDVCGEVVFLSVEVEEGVGSVSVAKVFDCGDNACRAAADVEHSVAGLEWTMRADFVEVGVPEIAPGCGSSFVGARLLGLPVFLFALLCAGPDVVSQRMLLIMWKQIENNVSGVCVQVFLPQVSENTAAIK